MIPANPPTLDTKWQHLPGNWHLQSNNLPVNPMFSRLWAKLWVFEKSWAGLHLEEGSHSIIGCFINPARASFILIGKIYSLLFIAQGIENQASINEIKIEPTPQFKLLESFPKCCLQVSPTQLLCTKTAQPLSKMIKLDSIKYSITPHLSLLPGHHSTVSPLY